jgi:phosphatidate cytidylyltransferase
MLKLLESPFMGVPTPLRWGFGAIAAVLIAGALAGAALPRLRPGGDFTNLRQRVASWWVMVALLAGALLLGWQATALLFGLISFMALREFVSLAPARLEDRPVIALAYLTIPVGVFFVFTGAYTFYVVLVPVYVFLAMPFVMACIGQTRGFLATTSALHWGIVTCAYNIGYIPFLMRVPQWDAPQAGPMGLVFLLLVATEANDVLQYVTGKLFGRHKITPKVSPNKTWEGFIGGWVLTAGLILIIGPVLSPLKGAGLWIIALTLPLAGFAGDVTFSAIKRDLGVKDTSHSIPGHGGVLDRVDSLTFTSPLYFHLLAYFALKTY